MWSSWKKLCWMASGKENVSGRVGKVKGYEVARWERQDSGEVGRWEVPGFIQGWGTQGESKILSFCFCC